MKRGSRLRSAAVVILLLAAMLGLASSAPLALEGADQKTSVSSKGEAQTTAEPLPLGRPNLFESREVETVSPGVTRTRIVRGERSGDGSYTVDVALVATEEEAQSVAEGLSEDGYEPRVEETSDRPSDAPGTGPLSHLVRAGSFPTEEEAADMRGQLEEAGYGEGGSYETPKVVYTGEDGKETTGPWVVEVLEVAPGSTGDVVPALSTGAVPDKEALTETLARSGAEAAVNGGYFVVEPEDGTPGDAAGISVVGGRLVSEAVNGRTGLLLPGGSDRPYVAALSSQQAATTLDGARRAVDGVNRKPGLVRNCGGAGGDEPTELPRHDFTCTDESELVLFTPDFGEETEPGEPEEGVEVTIDASGEVVEVRDEPGGEIPSDGTVLSGTGDAAEWLRLHAREGERLSVSTDVYADGEPLPLEGGLGIVNGGPRLLRDGEVDISARAEGFDREEDPGFYYAFGARRNPRTLAGVKPDGALLLVAVDGRAPDHSVGASFEESARLMKALGATEALNLDGGGSTTVALGGEPANRPSDENGERPIGDAVLILEEVGLPKTGGPPLAHPTRRHQ